MSKSEVHFRAHPLVPVRFVYLKILHDIGSLRNISFILLDLGEDTGNASTLNLEINL